MDYFIIPVFYKDNIEKKRSGCTSRNNKTKSKCRQQQNLSAAVGNKISLCTQQRHIHTVLRNSFYCNVRKSLEIRTLGNNTRTSYQPTSNNGFVLLLWDENFFLYRCITLFYYYSAVLHADQICKMHIACKGNFYKAEVDSMEHSITKCVQMMAFYGRPIQSYLFAYLAPYLQLYWFTLPNKNE